MCRPTGADSQHARPLPRVGTSYQEAVQYGLLTKHATAYFALISSLAERKCPPATPQSVRSSRPRQGGRCRSALGVGVLTVAVVAGAVSPGAAGTACLPPARRPIGRHLEVLTPGAGRAARKAVDGTGRRSGGCPNAEGRSSDALAGVGSAHLVLRLRPFGSVSSKVSCCSPTTSTSASTAPVMTCRRSLRLLPGPSWWMSQPTQGCSLPTGNS